jgi:hypothetical protein
LIYRTLRSLSCDVDIEPRPREKNGGWVSERASVCVRDFRNLLFRGEGAEIERGITRAIISQRAGRGRKHQDDGVTSAVYLSARGRHVAELRYAHVEVAIT